jgi:hypothetical protein
METSVLLVTLYLLAAWAWVCLVWVADHGLPRAILLQQRIGAYTPRTLYRVAGRGRWLAAGGAAVGVAGLMAGLGTETAVGLLVVAVALLTYLLAGMSKLLHPRVVAAILARLDSDGAAGPDEPDGPLPAA